MKALNGCRAHGPCRGARGTASHAVRRLKLQFAIFRTTKKPSYDSVLIRKLQEMPENSRNIQVRPEVSAAPIPLLSFLPMMSMEPQFRLVLNSQVRRQAPVSLAARKKNELASEWRGPQVLVENVLGPDFGRKNTLRRGVFHRVTDSTPFGKVTK